MNSLPRADAVALLLKIAARIGPHADTIARLCGDLPLALRLAGGALAVRENLTPEGYIKRLQDEKRLFKELGEVGDALAVREALLTPELRDAWQALAVFPADFDWPAAGAVWAGSVSAESEADTTDRLSELLRYSLLDYDAATGRYRLHDLARAWAEAQLTDEAKETARQRHAEHYRRVLARTTSLYLEGGDNVLRGLALFDQEQAHIEAGQAWATKHAEGNDQAAALCSDYPGAGAYVIALRYHSRKQIAWMEAALAAARHLGNKGNEGAALGNLGNAYAALGEPRRAIEFYEQRLVIARETGDRRGEGNALGNLGSTYLNLGEDRRAIEFYERQLTITRAIGDRRGEGNALSGLALAYADLGDARRAIEYHEQALVIARATGDRRGEGNALGNLGNAYHTLAELRRAIEFYEQQLTIAREVSDRRGEGNALWNMALARDRLGERQAAIVQAEAALKIYEQLEHPSVEMVRKEIAAWRQAEQPPADNAPPPK